MSLSAASRHPVRQTIKTPLRAQSLWMRMQWSKTIYRIGHSHTLCVSTYWCHTNSVTQSSGNGWNSPHLSSVQNTTFELAEENICRLKPLCFQKSFPSHISTLAVQPSCEPQFITSGSLQSYQKNRPLPPVLRCFSYPWHRTYRLTPSRALPRTLNLSPFPHSYSSTGNLAPFFLPVLSECPCLLFCNKWSGPRLDWFGPT